VLAEALGARLDADLLPRIYATAGVSTVTIRDELRAASLAFVEPESADPPDLVTLQRSIRMVVRRSSRQAAAVGVAGGVGGLSSIPPELAATLVLSLRLGQRLAVIHGFDPETDEGKIVLARALAAAYGVSLPEFGRVATRISDLPLVVRGKLPGASTALAWVGRQAIRRSSTTLAGRVLRSVPGLAASVSGFSAWRRHERLAETMCTVFARAMETQLVSLDDSVLAEEIAPEPRNSTH
jgi:hypothetical protein